MDPPPHSDILSGVESFLAQHNVSFASIIIHALQDPKSSLGEDLISRITDVLEALRPNLDAGPITELGRFFASIASSELSKLGKDDLWHLPASTLSAEELEAFSVTEMSRRIASLAPGFSTFLHAICVRKKAAGEVVADEDNDSNEAEVGPEVRRSIDPARLLEIKETAITNIILNARNRTCNAFQVAIGVYLHSTNTPDKVISTLHHAGLCISQASISRAIRSLSAEARESLSDLGRDLLFAYAYDNFDVMLKALVSTVEGDTDPLKHLTSGLIFPLQHDVQLEDLCVSAELWEKYEFNDMSQSAHRVTRAQMWTALIPRYNSLNAVMPASQRSRHEEFKVWIALRDLVESGPDYFQSFKGVLQFPEPIEERIPVKKTRITPVQSMDIPNSTVEGNIKTIERLLEQTGRAPLEEEGDTVNLDPYVVLFHGDLGTGERIQTAKRRRRIETSPRDRLQYVVFVMGLFHLKMACAETIWRIFVRNPDARAEHQKTSFFADLKILRPSEFNSVCNSFKFRLIHEAIGHIGTCRRLDCWRVVLKKRGFSSLRAFADTRPDWDLIKEVASEVSDQFIREPTQAGDGGPEGTDQELENNLTFNLYAGMYEEISYAMNHGDIGRVEMCLLKWVPLFEAVGKTKYAHHTLKLIYELNHVFPSRLSRAVRMNILINPSGHPGKFRAVDWVVELLNLFTKVTHAGKYSNRSIDHILNESPLIEVYRHLHETFEGSFCISKKTTSNKGPNMTKTYTELLKVMERNNTHTKVSGRKSKVDASSLMGKGIRSIIATSKSTTAEGIAGGEDDEVEAGEGEEEVGLELEDGDLLIDDQ